MHWGSHVRANGHLLGNIFLREVEGSVSALVRRTWRWEREEPFCHSDATDAPLPLLRTPAIAGLVNGAPAESSLTFMLAEASSVTSVAGRQAPVEVQSDRTRRGRRIRRDSGK